MKKIFEILIACIIVYLIFGLITCGGIFAWTDSILKEGLPMIEKLIMQSKIR